MKIINNLLFIAICTFMVSASQGAIADRKKKVGRGSPSLENIAYGINPRQVLDFYKAEHTTRQKKCFFIDSQLGRPK